MQSISTMKLVLRQNLPGHLFKVLKGTLNKPLYLIYSDICDLKFVQTISGNKYFITFVDDSTKYCSMYLLKSKNEAIDKFVLYKNEVENHLNKKIKVLRSDRGGERGSKVVDICAQHGIVHETTTRLILLNPMEWPSERIAL